MKLRNKKTGEIGNLVLNVNQNRESFTVVSTKNGDTLCGNAVVGDYDTLAELNAEWEDYEEPKGVKSIYFTGATVYIEMSNQKEAIEVEEKLQALERLRGKGLKVSEWVAGLGDDNYKIGEVMVGFDIDGVYDGDVPNDIEKDLDIVFGGEE